MQLTDGLGVLASIEHFEDFHQENSPSLGLAGRIAA